MTRSIKTTFTLASLMLSCLAPSAFAAFPAVGNPGANAASPVYVVDATSQQSITGMNPASFAVGRNSPGVHHARQRRRRAESR